MIEEKQATVEAISVSLNEALVACAPQKAAADGARVALFALLPTNDEYDLAALRGNIPAQETLFGADRAAALRASLAAKEDASHLARTTLNRAQRDFQAAVDVSGAAAIALKLEAAKDDLRLAMESQDT